jgi:hypothetical protein
LLEAFRQRYGGKVASSAITLFARSPSWMGTIGGRPLEIGIPDGDLIEVETPCSSGEFFLSLTPRSLHRGLASLLARIFRGARFEPDPEFDRAFLIQTNDDQGMRLSLGDSSVRTMIMQAEGLHLLRVQSGVLTIRKLHRRIDEGALGTLWNLADLACRMAVMLENTVGNRGRP